MVSNDSFSREIMEKKLIGELPSGKSDFVETSESSSRKLRLDKAKVDLIFELKELGYRSSTIRKILNTNGVLTSSGVNWEAKTIDSILNNEDYKKLYKQNITVPVPYDASKLISDWVDSSCSISNRDKPVIANDTDSANNFVNPFIEDAAKTKTKPAESRDVLILNLIFDCALKGFTLDKIKETVKFYSAMHGPEHYMLYDIEAILKDPKEAARYEVDNKTSKVLQRLETLKEDMRVVKERYTEPVEKNSPVNIPSSDIRSLYEKLRNSLISGITEYQCNESVYIDEYGNRSIKVELNFSYRS